MTADKADDVRILQLSDLAVDFPVAGLQLGNLATVFIPLLPQLYDFRVQINPSCQLRGRRPKP